MKPGEAGRPQTEAPPVFDLTATPLESGTTLIEASAGTGKTYTLAGLFLRLLLQHGLGVEQILVVTYTVAATAELRERVRGVLAQALRAVEAGAPAALAPDDRVEPFIWQVLARADGGPERQRKQLELALNSFDQAAIFTIHGFCQRALRDRAFESGSLFDTELVTDQSDLLRQAVEDFWRRHVLAAGPVPTACAVADVGSPDGLWQTVSDCLPHENLRVVSPAGDRSAETLAAELSGAWAAVRDEWLRDGAAIQAHFGAGARWAVRKFKDDAAMTALFAQVHACLAEDDLTAERLEALASFTTASLRRGSSKAKGAPSPPDLRFFRVCDQFAEAAERFRTGLRPRVLDFVRAELPRSKAALKVQSFDDLLTRLAAALDGASGDALAAGLRTQFRAALIDEFQDTDPVQWRIFRRVFAGGDHFLFLIGDPKQAIYGFRGADIFTYLDAARQAARRFTLRTNRRSAARLVAAVNTVFSANPQPFVFDEIRFTPAEPGVGNRADAAPLRVHGEAAPALQLWVRAAGEEPISIGDAERELPAAVAGEIVRLLNEGVTVGSRPLRPEDVAVLVPANHQAFKVQQALLERGVPCVLYATESLFAAPEAGEVRRVLAAIAEPAQEGLVKAALATPMLGATADRLTALTADDSAWQAVLDRFRGYREWWQDGGFITMFRRLLSTEGVRRRLLAFPDGERRLTNVLHLAEVLHQAGLEQNLGLTGLLKWFDAQLARPDRANEEQQLRLERDEQAVKLVTIHRSKGLEYGVVFCPFSWKGVLDHRGRDPKPVLFHEDGELILDLGASPDPAGREAESPRAPLARRERLAEQARLLYVALTRARHRVALVWGRFNTAGSSAAAWLLHPPEAAGEDPVARLSDHCAQLDDEAIRNRLTALAEQSGGALTVIETPEPTTENYRLAAGATPVLAPRPFTGRIQRDWRITSFSGLTAGHGAEQPDYDPAGPVPAEAAPATGIFAFPRGTRAGTCLHKILERLDFPRWREPATRDAVTEELRAHGVPVAEFGEIVDEMIGRVMTVPLPLAPEGKRASEGEPGSRTPATLALAGVEPDCCLRELEFCFPLGRLSTGRLEPLLASHGVPGADAPERLAFSDVTGLLKGFIDLVFEWRGRYYLVDWKSNWLGDRVEDYGAESLRAEMARHHYDLQYLLYTVALDKYLRLRLPGYRYADHFGGVFYVFVRGLDPQRPELGIFCDRPAENLIRELSEMLSDADARRTG